MGTRWLAMSVAVLIAPLSVRAAEPLKLALVIGNGSYQALPPLPSCLSSARVVAATLQRAGFTVREQTNESNGRLGTAISDFADALADAAGVGVVPPPEPPVPVPLAPSRPDGARLGPVPRAASPLTARDDAGHRFLRGNLVHTLLQYLPDLLPEPHDVALDVLLNDKGVV